MTFDTKKFMGRKFEHRTEDVGVSELSEFFEDEDKPVWVVRGLEGHEIGACKLAVAKDKALQAVVSMLKSENVSKKVEALEAVLDLGQGRRTGDIPERIHQLAAGSVEPKCDIEFAVKLARVYPVTFYNLTNKILQLSGQGMKQAETVGKQESSLETPTS